MHVRGAWPNVASTPLEWHSKVPGENTPAWHLKFASVGTESCPHTGVQLPPEGTHAPSRQPTSASLETLRGAAQPGSVEVNDGVAVDVSSVDDPRMSDSRPRAANIVAAVVGVGARTGSQGSAPTATNAPDELSVAGAVVTIVVVTGPTSPKSSSDEFSAGAIAAVVVGTGPTSPKNSPDEFCSGAVAALSTTEDAGGVVVAFCDSTAGDADAAVDSFTGAARRSATDVAVAVVVPTPFVRDLPFTAWNGIGANSDEGHTTEVVDTVGARVEDGVVVCARRNVTGAKTTSFAATRATIVVWSTVVGVEWIVVIASAIFPLPIVEGAAANVDVGDQAPQVTAARARANTAVLFRANTASPPNKGPPITATVDVHRAGSVEDEACPLLGSREDVGIASGSGTTEDVLTDEVPTFCAAAAPVVTGLARAVVEVERLAMVDLAWVVA